MTKDMVSAAGAGLLACGIVLGATFAPGDAMAQSSVKELMGKAQSKSNTQAVEDLIKKLQGPKAPEAAAAPSSGVPQPAVQEAAKPMEPKPAPSEPPVATSPKPSEPKVAAPQPEKPAVPAEKLPPASSETKEAKTTPAEPPAKAPEPASASAEAVVEKASRNELPSADLEVYFDYSSAEISPAATEVLNTLGSALADGRLAGDKFLIAGHTDARGRASVNRVLSQQRAESVRAYLIENFKIDPQKLEAKGFGESKLKNTDNPNADENRRVQVINVSSAAAQR